MSYEQAIQAAHLELSAADWEFRQLALQNPDYQRRANFPLFAQPSDLFIYRLQPWPTFVGGSKLQEMKTISVAVSLLIRSILDRVFANDPAAISKYYGLANPAVVGLLLNPMHGFEAAISRGDFVLTAAGFKCIEFNMVPNLGGWETAFLAEMHLKTTLTSQFIQKQQLTVRYSSTLDIMFKHILQDLLSVASDANRPQNLVIAFEGDISPEALSRFGSVFAASYRKACEEVGAASKSLLLPCYPSQLAVDNDGTLSLGRQPIHGLVILYKATAQMPATILRSFLAGKVKLYNSPVCSLLGDKRNLAILSLLASTGMVSAAERQLIEKVIPWTRTSDVPPALQQAAAAISAAELVARREDLVLKTSQSFGGQDVYIGRFTPPQEWQAIVQRALGSPQWVIQEYLQSVPLLYQNGEAGCSPHNVIWGPFVFGKTYGGTILRMQPQADKTPVNLSLTATEGMIFEVD